eukprot:gnl/Trimastix_PCT/1495.p1 GENE.gnl/Trimastix_PCT/1495~~gnl/Trimastix_PCT/1495.p1  ORF type:complete len:417 (-),score=81.81 gnl/Trimastix_PCT/1495:4-1254(-)
MSDSLVFDWNQENPSFGLDRLTDETLRDGLQDTTVTLPSEEEKIQGIRLLNRLGIYAASFGYPNATIRIQDEIKNMLQVHRDEQMTVLPTVAGRTAIPDVEACTRVVKETNWNRPVLFQMFIGSSPLRMHIEQWEVSKVESLTRDALRYVKSHGHPDIIMSYVTEDTTRSNPETLRRIFGAALEEGADALLLCDTAGYSTPAGTRRIVDFARDFCKEKAPDRAVRIGWHGHDDRGLSLANALAALDAGCEDVHGTVLGIGERVGNTSLDQLVINHMLRSHEPEEELMKKGHTLRELVELVSRATHTPLPTHYPAFGRTAFQTSSGVHAAAVRKALKMQGGTHMADLVYSSVPARHLGLTQQLLVGPMSGAHNAYAWLEQHGLEPNDKSAASILDAAKQSDYVLTDDQVQAAISASP